MESIVEQRQSGVLLPLFSLRSDSDWGIGEYADIPAFAEWMEEAGLSLLMLLPMLEASLGQESPYAALSAFALDPIHLSLGRMEDFAELGGEAALPAEDRRSLDALRQSAIVAYEGVRPLKERWLRRSFERFRASGAAADSERAGDLQRFREEHRSWLDDYALFRTLKERLPPGGWWEWEAGLRDREPTALQAAKERWAEDFAYYEYLQWIAFRQLGEARAEALRSGVRLGGDLPFMVAEDSADVWSNQEIFSRERSVGVPPDAMAAEGQDWGLPAYRWRVLAERGYDWLIERGRQAAELYDLVRIDHVVGFYRTYLIPRNGSPPFFDPADEAEQLAQGEATMEAFRACGVALVAEDLGTVPPFVRESLERLGIPGYRVMRWEKDDGRFRDPEGWPSLSLATTGTHDTEAVAAWWEAMEDEERQAVLALSAFRGLGGEEVAHFDERVRDAVLEAVYRSGSRLLVLPFPDLVGSRERINLPGTVGPHNWSYRLPWTVVEMRRDPFVRERTTTLRTLAAHTHRLPHR